MNASHKSLGETHALRLAESLRSRSTFQVVIDCLIHGSISSTALIEKYLCSVCCIQITKASKRTWTVCCFTCHVRYRHGNHSDSAIVCSTYRRSLDFWLRCMSASGLCRHSNGSRLAADHGSYVYRSIFSRCSSNETSNLLYNAPRPGHGRVGLDLISDVSGPVCCQWQKIHLSSGKVFLFPRSRVDF